jgi:thymidylate synthase (FAD)
MYLPTCVRERDVKLKQGSKATEVPLNDQAHYIIKETNELTNQAYKKLLLLNVAPEVARTILPQGMYTEFIETGSLAAYSRLCALRLDPSAQWEIRQYAASVSSLMEEAFPVSWKALQPEGWKVPPLAVQPSGEAVHAAVNGC